MTNITESAQINRLVAYLCGRDEVSQEKAIEALAYLADRAYKALMAGPDGDFVRANWRGAPAPVTLGDPPPELADAWARFQHGGDVEPAELRALDEWRCEQAEAAGF